MSQFATGRDKSTMVNSQSIHGWYCVGIGARWRHRNSTGVDFSQRGFAPHCSRQPDFPSPALPTALARIMRQQTATISLSARSALHASSIFLRSAPWRGSREIRVNGNRALRHISVSKCYKRQCSIYNDVICVLLAQNLSLYFLKRLQ